MVAHSADILNLNPRYLRYAFGSAGGGSTINRGDELTRAFTEGDVAMAKLKSMEMGDAICSRLFATIELRSEMTDDKSTAIATRATSCHATPTVRDGSASVGRKE